MNANYFKALLQELIDENPFSVRAVLKILDVQFTESIPTLAVTREGQPRLLVNLSFLQQHCHTEQQVKAVIVHEFLHVLLRPMNGIEHDWYAKCTKPGSPLHRFCTAWCALYDGTLIADDIEALAGEVALASSGWTRVSGPIVLGSCAGTDIGDLLGNHEELDQELPEGLRAALDEAMKEMNGAGIWREPKSRGIGANPYEALFHAKDEQVERWKIKTLAVLKQFLRPDSTSTASHPVPQDYRIPVLSPGDRRAFMRSLWSPFLPDAAWSTTVSRREGTAQVYLDVSGSMSAEMPLVIALLGQLARYIRRPFWAFSDGVSPAVIEQGKLKTATSGGTSMSCVLRHLAATRPACAVIVTDGYIEQVDPKLMAQAAATRLHALVTRDGNPAALHRVGIPYTQLGKVPS